MFRDVLSAVDGITVLPVAAMLIFITLFALMLIWVFRLSRDYIEHARHIPLDDEPVQEPITNRNQE